MFRSVQSQMTACLSLGDLFEHPGACGDVAERGWIDLFNRYLPRRYRATPAFVVDADGGRSRQIDIAVYDNLYSAALFPNESGVHIPAESVYAIFEVKHTLTSKWIVDAGRKAASVRRLRRTSSPVVSGGRLRPALAPQPILAGVLAVRGIWRGDFARRLSPLLARLPESQALDLGCVLEEGAFERSARAKHRFSAAEDALIFFVIRLLERLRHIGTAPAADLMEYARDLPSFKP